MKELFKNIFASGDQLASAMGHEIQSEEDLESCLARSGAEPVFIFKHSTRCSISFGAHRRLEEYLRDNPGVAEKFYLLKVVESRPVSNAAAERLGVAHQSPQLILVKDGAAQWDASHHMITPGAIEQALAGAQPIEP